MAWWSNGCIVVKTEKDVSRKCPFCSLVVVDDVGHDTNFVAHCSYPTEEHRHNWSWVNYAAMLKAA